MGLMDTMICIAGTGGKHKYKNGKCSICGKKQ